MDQFPGVEINIRETMFLAQWNKVVGEKCVINKDKDWNVSCSTKLTDYKKKKARKIFNLEF